MAKIVAAAGIFLVNKDGELLVCHPTNHKADFWSIPKGKVEEGETNLDAALRETEEETNLNLRSALFTVHELDAVTYKHGKKILHPFLFWENRDSRIDWDKADIKCMSNVPEDRGGFPEMDDYKWLGIEESREFLHDTQEACLDKVIELVNSKNNVTVF